MNNLYKNSEQTKSLYEEKDDWKLESDTAFANDKLYIYMCELKFSEYTKRSF